MRVCACACAEEGAASAAAILGTVVKEDLITESKLVFRYNPLPSHYFNPPPLHHGYYLLSHGDVPAWCWQLSVLSDVVLLTAP